ncbi:hypothetical protein P280DRAFT_438026 [Massarina eburnea CBS 473.64]|uniref:Symplekin/Pta1 N-terminal domain-containing protein n=1 Tax=Massarina eburnea CBS 473.64 TaxID=1395130 RepID=A0A6A6RIU9_9PLEO|nr:hypothetical protein P280DRAFT_438026 [Massarina eburnea CBS 473.64]
MAQSMVDQLDAARRLALNDGANYPNIIPGVLPIVGANSNATLEIRRWGADFLAEAFSAPTWSPDQKQSCATLGVLESLKEYLEMVQDRAVIKNAILTAATVYPLIYRHTISNPNDSHNWQLMQAIKSNILQRMDAAPSGVRICCIKFVQQVVLTETPGMVDPRRPDPNDISLALLPRNHALLPYGNLEAEGHGLLDRLLDIIHGDHSDALLVTAVLNTLGMLVQRRPIAAKKIIDSVLNFNPLKLANSPMTPKNRVIMKSIERTTRALLINVMKRNPENPHNGRIQQYLERMNRMRFDIFDDSSRKRPAPVEHTDGPDAAKRQRLRAAVPSATPIPTPTPPAPVTTLPPGPVSYRQLFTLNPDNSIANFDVQVFKDPEQLIVLVVHLLQKIDEAQLGNAINVIRSRWLGLSNAAHSGAPTAPVPMPLDDEEEYEPDFEPEDAEQIVNRLDNLPPTEVSQPSATSLAPYKLPEAPPLTEQEVQKYGEMSVRDAFKMLGSVDEKEKNKATKSAFNRLAASDYGRDAWITILSRLATRASAGLDDPDEGIKDEYAVKNVKGNLSISDAVRNRLYAYVMYDWRKRIDVAISWLNEEWYNDTILAQAANNGAKISSTNGNAVNSPPKGNYQRCALRLVDSIYHYVEHTDKVFLRFISEMPQLDYDILSRLIKMAEDPERIDLACKVLQYLHMFRPPIRNVVVDILLELWKGNDRARPSTGKLLKHYRPDIALGDTNGNGASGDGGEVKMEGKMESNGANEMHTVS